MLELLHIALANNAQSLKGKLSQRVLLNLNISRLLFSARLFVKAEKISLSPSVAGTISSFKEHLWSRKTFENSTQASVLIDPLLSRSRVWSVLHSSRIAPRPSSPILFQPRTSVFSCRAVFIYSCLSTFNNLHSKLRILFLNSAFQWYKNHSIWS